jgi:hypothetical protein
MSTSRHEHGALRPSIYFWLRDTYIICTGVIKMLPRTTSLLSLVTFDLFSKLS